MVSNISHSNCPSDHEEKKSRITLNMSWLKSNMEDFYRNGFKLLCKIHVNRWAIIHVVFCHAINTQKYWTLIPYKITKILRALWFVNRATKPPIWQHYYTRELDNPEHQREYNKQFPLSLADIISITRMSFSFSIYTEVCKEKQDQKLVAIKLI